MIADGKYRIKHIYSGENWNPELRAPLSAPGIIAGSLLVFIPSLGAYLAPDLLGGARTAYLGNLVQSQFAIARDVPFGAALSVALSVLVMVGLFALRRPLARTGTA